MEDTYYIRLVPAPSQVELGRLVSMDSVDIICTKEGRELMTNGNSLMHGPIYQDHFFEYKKSLCEENIFHIFHGPDLKQFAENYFFIDPTKYEQAVRLLPEKVNLFDFGACRIL